MWPMQAANSPSDYAITVGNVIPITYFAKTGEGLKSAQTTTSQKNPSSSLLSTEETLLRFWSPALIALNQWTCMWANQAIHTFKVLGAPITPITCSPTQDKQAFMGWAKWEPYWLLLRPLLQFQESGQRALSALFKQQETR